MLKKTVVGLSLGAIVFRALVRLNKDKVRGFESHVIEEGETLGEIIQIYNPLLRYNPAVISDLVGQVKLLNPHNKTFSPGTQVCIPILMEFSNDVAYSILHLGSHPPQEFKSIKHLNASIRAAKVHDPKIPISVMDFNKNHNLIDQFVGEARHW